MSGFNPWLGFPARNAIYLDRDFDRQRGNGQAAFGTFQTAYTAAAALAVSTGETVLIYVGEGTAAQLGSLVLTANWDVRVILAGISKDLSKVGTITGTNAGTGYSVVASFLNITVGSITTSTTDLTGTFDSGVVTISGNGRESCVIGTVTTTAPINGSNGGNVTLSDLTCTTIATSSGSASGGDIVLTNVTVTSNITNTAGNEPGTLTATNSILPETVTMDGASNTGDIALDRCTAFIFNLGTVQGGAQREFRARNSKLATVNNISASSDRNVKLWDCIMIAGGATWNIEHIEDATIIDNCILVASGGGSNCISSCNGTAGTSQIIGSVLIPSGTARSIVGSAGCVILVDNMRVKNDVDPNVTIVGSYTVNGNYASPF